MNVAIICLACSSRNNWCMINEENWKQSCHRFIKPCVPAAMTHGLTPAALQWHCISEQRLDEIVPLQSYSTDLTDGIWWYPLSLFYNRMLTSLSSAHVRSSVDLTLRPSPGNWRLLRLRSTWVSHNILDCRPLTNFYLILLSTAATSNPGFTQFTQNNGLIMPCLMETRQNTATVNSSLTHHHSAANAGGGGAPGAASYFDIASTNPTLNAAAAAAAAAGHLNSAFNPRVTEALTINNNASLFSQKAADLHRSAAGTLILSTSPRCPIWVISSSYQLLIT